MKIAVAGATGKTGRHLVARLCSDGHRVVALGRDPARFAAVDSRADRRLADFTDARAHAAALEGAEAVVNCAEARFTEAVLAALPPDCRRLVLTSTMRRFLAEPDEPGRHAAHAETALDRHLRAHPGRTGIIVHFGMIYGPPDDANVERLLAVVRRWPSWLPLIAPLPGGGRATVQPIYMDDAVETLQRALDRDDSGPPITAAGPPITYAEMVRHCARALGRCSVVLAMPAALPALAISLGMRLPFDPKEWRRTAESKRQSLDPLHARLGIAPRSFAEGLAAKLARLDRADI